MLEEGRRVKVKGSDGRCAQETSLLTTMLTTMHGVTGMKQILGLLATVAHTLFPLGSNAVTCRQSRKVATSS